MWRPWSKKLFKLAIAADSMAICDAQGEMLFTHKMDTQEASSQAIDFAQMNALLETSQIALKNQSVEIILSHHFVRFLVLPWQNHVFQMQDWQAIAQQAFKKEFGAIANDWQVAVHYHGVGKSIFAAAMDKSMLNFLVEAAQRYDFSIKQISPLLDACWRQHLSEKDWLLIAEPQRLLLVQMLAGISVQVAVDMPPLGQEQLHAEQLVQRTLIQTPSSLRPTRVLTIVSGAIQSHWQEERGSMITLVNPMALNPNVLNAHVHNQTHAAWMGRL